MKLKEWINQQGEAISHEKRLIKSGLQVSSGAIAFSKKVLAFRKSGLWACTPQHHTTWAAWCYYAAPKMKLSRATLQAYGAPTYVMNHARTKELGIGSFWVYGEAALFLRKAIVRAIAFGYTGTVRPRKVSLKNTSRGKHRMAKRIAVAAIANFFLKNAKRIS